MKHRGFALCAFCGRIAGQPLPQNAAQVRQLAARGMACQGTLGAARPASSGRDPRHSQKSFFWLFGSPPLSLARSAAWRPRAAGGLAQRAGIGESGAPRNSMHEANREGWNGVSPHWPTKIKGVGI